MIVKEPMTPAEFDAAKREFEASFHGFLHQTSGTRSVIGNAEAESTHASKHLFGMAADYRLEEGAPFVLESLTTRAMELGFWFKLYGWGIHIQGLPPGTIAEWWSAKYGH